jgi:CheY-like chemotaxis protein
VAASSNSLQGLPVLAADDNATNRRLLEATLAAWGVAPTIVEDGRAAMVELERARAAGRSFNLVLLDARMPDLDGFAVAERIRQEPALAGVTVMLLTSDVMSGDLARCRELGVARHLVKPFTPSELLNAVLLALGQSVEPTTPLARASREASTKRLHVLVAEDNAVNQRVIVRLLEKMGHIPILAYNGQEAVECVAASQLPFDVALMDVQMPVMTARGHAGDPKEAQPAGAGSDHGADRVCDARRSRAMPRGRDGRVSDEAGQARRARGRPEPARPDRPRSRPGGPHRGRRAIERSATSERKRRRLGAARPRARWGHAGGRRTGSGRVADASPEAGFVLRRAQLRRRGPRVRTSYSASSSRTRRSG